MTARHRQRVCEAAGLALTPENTGHVTLEEKAAHAEVLKDVVQVIYYLIHAMHVRVRAVYCYLSWIRKAYGCVERLPPINYHLS